MKKAVMAIVFIGLTLGNSVFAGDKEVGKRVLRAFEREFTKQDISNQCQSFPLKIITSDQRYIIKSTTFTSV
jgi:hypothetical protein